MAPGEGLSAGALRLPPASCETDPFSYKPWLVIALWWMLDEVH